MPIDQRSLFVIFLNPECNIVQEKGNRNHIKLSLKYVEYILSKREPAKFWIYYNNLTTQRYDRITLNSNLNFIHLILKHILIYTKYPKSFIKCSKLLFLLASA